MEDRFGDALARAARGGDDDVDAAASVLAADADWDTVAARSAEGVTGDCVRRGWEPQDLVRMAGRELGPLHQRLAAGLSATGLGAFARAERLDRFSAATAYVELLRLYVRLPAIPAIPAPSSAAPGEAAPPKMLARIRALLAKAESTGYPDEAEALSAKAQHLMARHSIDAALLAASHDGGTGAGARRIGVERPYEGAKALLLDAVAEANRCRSVWSSELGFSTVVGHASDLDAVELLYTSLLVQADRALHRGRTSRSRDFRESFLIAYASRIRARLAEATAATEAEESAATPGLLPALASRALAVEDTTRRLFPTTTTSRLRARDADGWQHGESAADSAHLH